MWCLFFCFVVSYMQVGAERVLSLPTLNQRRNLLTRDIPYTNIKVPTAIHNVNGTQTLPAGVICVSC